MKLHNYFLREAARTADVATIVSVFAAEYPQLEKYIGTYMYLEKTLWVPADIRIKVPEGAFSWDGGAFYHEARSYDYSRSITINPKLIGGT